MTPQLSECIRLGALLKTQTVGHLTDGLGTCAIGAALDAIGKLEMVARLPGLYRELWWEAYWPILALRVPHPKWGDVHRVDRIIFDLNDGQGWTRDRIADWLSGIEQQQEAAELEKVAVA